MPASVPFGEDLELIRDVRIPTDDPLVTLSADLLLPQQDKPVPALINLHPYRKDVRGVGNDDLYEFFARHGYAVIVVDIKGTGQSDGKRRPEFDSSEGQDALDAFRWVRAQRWCSGSVGMWGISYGAITTLRAASLRPEGLDAFIALHHGLDPERATVHPDGQRGDLHALMSRAASMLASEVLPPLTAAVGKGDRDRWLERLATLEPVMVDYARHPPGHKTWRERAIDGESIVAPGLFVGGWRDAFPHELIDAFERSNGPKQLIVGPWGHAYPHRSVHGAVDFPSIAVRWWDRWLKGGPDADPPVSLHVGGYGPDWRAFDKWPPHRECLTLSTAESTVLRAGSHRGRSNAIGRYVSDPTHGTLRVLPGLAFGEFADPIDQHADDMRAFCVTSEPFTRSVTIVGRPTVDVHVGASDEPLARLVVRLTDVDSDGVSRLITMGVAVAEADDRIRVVLKPIAYRLPPGHRLRVAVSDSDFPRLTPLGRLTFFDVNAVRLELPVVPTGLGRSVEWPGVSRDADPGPVGTVRWDVTRHRVNDAVTVLFSIGAIGSETSPGEVVITSAGHRLKQEATVLATVHASLPAGFRMEGHIRREVELRSGERVLVTADSWCTAQMVRATAEVIIDGSRVYGGEWEQPLFTQPVDDGLRSGQD